LPIPPGMRIPGGRKSRVKGSRADKKIGDTGCILGFEGNGQGRQTFLMAQRNKEGAGKLAQKGQGHF
jgi:hypothetical protein